LSFTKSMMTRR